MDVNLHSVQVDNVDTKGAFRKPLNVAASRKYRRPSVASRSSASCSDGSPSKREYSLSPVFSRGNHSRISDYRPKWNDGGNQYKDSHRHSDREFSRSSKGYKKPEGHVRHDRHEDSQRSSYGSSHLQLEDDHRSRDHGKDMDRYPSDKHDVASFLYNPKCRDSDLSDRIGASRKHSNEQDRDTSDNKSQYNSRDFHRSSGDSKSDHPSSHDDSWGRSSHFTSSRDSAGHQVVRKSHHRELDHQDKRKQVKKFNNGESTRDKDNFVKGTAKRHENRTGLSEYEKSASKKTKFYCEGSDDIGIYGVEKQPSNVKQSSGFSTIEDMKPPVLHNNPGGGSGLDAAKVAAMKAAELVNKNISGGGCMSTEQKKKLLWGNKKTVLEESGHCWDASLFPDRERQEKFNKLMGVKVESQNHHPVSSSNQGGGGPQAEKQKELQMDLEKQYTAGLRRRDGRTVGLGL